MTAFLTLWSQDSVRVAYTDLKEILVLASKGEKLDSLERSYEAKIFLLESKVYDREEQLQLSGELITEQLAHIGRMESEVADLKKRRKILRSLFFGALVVIGVETIVILT